VRHSSGHFGISGEQRQTLCLIHLHYPRKLTRTASASGTPSYLTEAGWTVGHVHSSPLVSTLLVAFHITLALMTACLSQSDCSRPIRSGVRPLFSTSERFSPRF